MAMKLRVIVGLALGMLLTGMSFAQNAPWNDNQRRDGGYDNHRGWQRRMSADDQSKFDSYYSRWIEYRQTNNRDQMGSMENRMRDLMARYQIPPNTDFAQVASSGAGRGRGRRSFPTFSAEDASRFRSYYSRWQSYISTHNGDQARSMEGRMRDVMNRYGVRGDVSYDEVMRNLNGRY